MTAERLRRLHLRLTGVGYAEAGRSIGAGGRPLGWAVGVCVLPSVLIAQAWIRSLTLVVNQGGRAEEAKVGLGWIMSLGCCCCSPEAIRG